MKKNEIEEKIIALSYDLKIIEQNILECRNMESLLEYVSKFNTVFVQYTYLNMFRVSQLIGD